MGMSWVRDARFAVRVLLKDPGFTLVVVAALALGIGANTTVFTLVNAVLFRGLPFDQPDRVIYLTSANLAKNRTDMGVSYPDFRDWRAQVKTFQGLAAFDNTAMVIADDASAPERYQGSMVSANFFSLIGQKPLLGRDFLPQEDRPGAPPVCIIGYSIWDARYGRDARILGKSIRINDVATTIVGVMPGGMKFPVNADLWTSLVPTAAREKREARDMQVFGRLAAGVSLDQAKSGIAVIASRLEKAYPKSNQGITSRLMPYNDEFNGGPIRQVFLVLLGAVGFVLLIACANVANLLLARSLARHREVSIRAALGAGRWLIIRQLLVESLLLCLTGAAGGWLLAIWGVRLFDLAVANVGKPYWIVFRMDFTVFAYVAAICLATAVLCGLAPALQLSRVDLNATLKEGGRGSSRAARSRFLSGALVVVEVALSVVLLVGAGLMIRSFLKAYGMSDGLHAERYLVMRLSLPASRYPDADARARFYDRLEPRLASVPGVESMTIASQIPMSGAMDWKFEIDGRAQVDEDKLPSTDGLVASPSYLRTLELAVLRGRAFTESDGLPSKGAVIVNQRFAAKYFSGEDPLGKRIRIHWNGDRPWLTVVGVAQDFRPTNPNRAEIDPLLYVPLRSQPSGGYSILVRAASPASLTSALRKEIQAVDSALPVFGVMTLEGAFEQRRWPYRVFGTLFAVFAGIALLLAAMGLYAVMAYSVTRRTQEIGVRVAMGASGGRVLLLVLSQGLRQLALGMAAGLAGAFGLARVLKTLLFQTTPTDLSTFVAISAVLIAVGLVACWLPARGALRIDPVVALRYE